MSHPCNRFSCPEYNQGECFGGGCSTNPIPKEDLEKCEEVEEKIVDKDEDDEFETEESD